jgi:importin subunit alpha-2
LRKQKKEDQVLKRRNIAGNEGSGGGEEENILNDKTNVACTSGTAVNLTLVEIIDIISKPADSEQLFNAVQSIRKMLSRERNPPIDDVIKANLVSKLVHYLSCEENTNLQFEAAWALTNIASGTPMQTRHVVEAGAIKPFIKLLSSPNTNVCEQSVWALGNIAGDGAELRDLVIEFGIIKPLLALIRPDTPNTFLRNITWTISNLCRNKNPAPSMQVINELLPALASLLYSNDKEVLTDTCWALSYVTDGPNEKIDAVVRTGVIPRLVELLNFHHKNEVGILSPALRCIGNIVTGSDEQTQAVIDSHVLPIFHALLTHSKISVQKEAAWALSNITAGTQSQIQAVIGAELVPLLVHVLSVGELRVQKEAAWAITNYTSGASTEQVLYLVQCQVIKPMCDLLTAKDSKLLKVLLDGLINILMVIHLGECLGRVICVLNIKK